MNMQLPLRQIMAPDPVSIRLGAPLSKVRELLDQHAFHHIPVVSGRGRVVGILSSADLARVSLDAWVQDKATVNAELDASFDLSQIMTHEPVTATPDTTIRQAAELLGDGHFHSLPVVDSNGELVGMVTTTDLMRHFAAHWS